MAAMNDRPNLRTQKKLSKLTWLFASDLFYSLLSLAIYNYIYICIGYNWDIWQYGDTYNMYIYIHLTYMLGSHICFSCLAPGGVRATIFSAGGAGGRFAVVGNPRSI